MSPPRDVDHPQIVKGLRQSKARSADYFIWTNGDCWQFYSLDLEKAPIYKVTLSEEPPEDVADKLKIIEKKTFSQDPRGVDRAIQGHWKDVALPVAWEELIENPPSEFIQPVKDRLPTELGLVDDDILAYLRGLRPPESVGDLHPSRRRKKIPARVMGPADWKDLLHSDESDFVLARRQFSRRENRTLAAYLVDPARYKEWKAIGRTWRLAGLAERDARSAGSVVYTFKKWNFIVETDDGERYRRVEEGVEYPKQLLEILGTGA